MLGRKITVLLTLALLVLVSESDRASTARNRTLQSRHSEVPYGPITDGFRLSAQPDSAVVLSGEPIILNLTLTNTSNETRLLDAESAFGSSCNET